MPANDWPYIWTNVISFKYILHICSKLVKSVTSRCYWLIIYETTSFITKNCTNENIIGDFNCQLDRREVKSVKFLHNLLKHFDLYHVWEHPSTMGYTWCDANDEPKSRIDYVFINKTFHYVVRNIVVRKIPETHSNGSRMIIDFSTTNKGPG